PSARAAPRRGGMAGHLEALAGVGDVGAVDLEDREVLIEIIAHQLLDQLRYAGHELPERVCRCRTCCHLLIKLDTGAQAAPFCQRLVRQPLVLVAAPGTPSPIRRMPLAFQT